MDQGYYRGSGLLAGDCRGRGVGWEAASPGVHLGTVPGLAAPGHRPRASNRGGSQQPGSLAV